MALEVLITSGGTICKIDDVRHIGNFSSGSTGALVAEEFLKHGNNVHYLYSKNGKRPFHEQFIFNPRNDFYMEVEKMRKLYHQARELLGNLHEYPFLTFDDYRTKVKDLITTKKIDVIVLAAAVSDYGVKETQGKISSNENNLDLKLIKLPKIISEVKQYSPKIYQVGFKLLSRVNPEELIETAHDNLIKNNSDLVVANTLIEGSFADRKIYLITKDKQVLPCSARELPNKLVEFVSKDINLSKKY